MSATEWSDFEKKLLTREYRKGLSYRRISEILEANGTPRTLNSIDKQVRNLNLKRKHEALTDGLRVGHLDIESSQLNASFGFIVSWAIKEDGSDKIIGDYLRPSDFKQKDELETDKRVVMSLTNELKKFDAVTTFFGTYFDIPFIRSRCMAHGQTFLGYGELIHIDVCKIVKRTMKLHSHRLEAVAGHLDVNSKTKLEPKTWARAVMGNTEAIAEVYHHNREDVITLEKVYNLIKPYWAGTRTSI